VGKVAVRTKLRSRPGRTLFIALLAFAGLALGSTAASAGGPQATASAGVTKQLKQLKQQVAQLQQQVAALSRQPGPQGAQGAQGPAGSAPACQGNGSGDTMVAAGAVCIDRYEVSVWSSPTGGTQYGATSDNYPAACTDTGQGCKAGTPGEIYARSVAGVTPSSRITYFQAQQALANSGKRLPTSAEWQQAVAGTPDSASCRVSGGSAVATGSLAGCISNFGANDMVGNLVEMVADWVPSSTICLNWDTDGTFSSDDAMCLAGADATNDATDDGPGALIRGGNFADGALAGPFAVIGFSQPSTSSAGIGFRGAR
jgi:hypothetical protein